MSIYTVIQKIVTALRNGEREFSQYIQWLRNEGMEQGEAENMLERLIRQVEEE